MKYISKSSLDWGYFILILFNSILKQIYGYTIISSSVSVPHDGYQISWETGLMSDVIDDSWCMHQRMWMTYFSSELNNELQ